MCCFRIQLLLSCHFPDFLKLLFSEHPNDMKDSKR